MIMTPETNDPMNQKILWSSVSRDKTILVEAGDDHFHGAVTQAAKAILAKKNTPGWEYHTCKSRGTVIFGSRQKQAEEASSSYTKDNGVPRLKAVKFHVYEHHSNDWDMDFEDEVFKEPVVWVFAAVYNPSATTWEDQTTMEAEVKSFIQKMIILTAMPRLSDKDWRYGSTMACQKKYAPILLQRMEDVTYLGRIARLNQSVQETSDLMQSNISAILEREDNLRDMEERTSQLALMATSFRRGAKGIRRRMMMQNAKYGLAVGSLVTTLVGICVIPPLVVAL